MLKMLLQRWHLLLQKHGLIPVEDVEDWLWIFQTAWRAEQERQYIEDCRVDYGGI